MRFFIGTNLFRLAGHSVYGGASFQAHPFHEGRIFVKDGSNKPESIVGHAVAIGLGLGGMMWLLFYFIGH